MVSAILTPNNGNIVLLLFDASGGLLPFLSSARYSRMSSKERLPACGASAVPDVEAEGREEDDHKRYVAPKPPLRANIRP